MSSMEIEVRRSRRKTLAIEITRDAKVIVRAPYNVPVTKIKQFLSNKSDWIERNLAKMQSHMETRELLRTLSEAELQALVQKAKQVLVKRTDYYAPLIGVTYGKITIRKQKTRWGSCSSTGNLNFNCLLMLTPPEVQDYVVVHELCHRKEMNHSARFWQEVGKVLPDYPKRRKWLKENGADIIGAIENIAEKG